MFKRIDRSAFLGRLLDRTSEKLSEQRGLPVIIGIIFVIIGLVAQLINFAAPSPALELIGVLGYGVGTLTALFGLLIATPIGK